MGCGGESIPRDAHLAAARDDVAFGASKFHDVAKQCDIHPAILDHFLFFSGAPPFDGIDAGASLRVAESVFGELIESQAMAELLVEDFVNVKRERHQVIDACVGAKNFEVEAI